MSSDPIDIGDDDAVPLDLVWYGGPVRADGGNRTRLAITRQDGPRSSVDLSLPELGRLANTAGVLRWEATPYGHPGWGDDDTAPEETPPETAPAQVLRLYSVWDVEGNHVRALGLYVDDPARAEEHARNVQGVLTVKEHTVLGDYRGETHG